MITLSDEGVYSSVVAVIHFKGHAIYGVESNTADDVSDGKTTGKMVTPAIHLLVYLSMFIY